MSARLSPADRYSARRRRADLEAAIEAGGTLSAKKIAREIPAIKNFIMYMARCSTKGMSRTPWYGANLLEFEDGSFTSISREIADQFLALPEAEVYRLTLAYLEAGALKRNRVKLPSSEREQ